MTNTTLSMDAVLADLNEKITLYTTARDALRAVHPGPDAAPAPAPAAVAQRTRGVPYPAPIVHSVPAAVEVTTGGLVKPTPKRRGKGRVSRAGLDEGLLARPELHPTFTAAKVAELTGAELKTAYAYCYRMRAKELLENVGLGVWRVLPEKAGDV